MESIDSKLLLKSGKISGPEVILDSLELPVPRGDELAGC